MPSGSYHVFALPPEVLANIAPRDSISTSQHISPEPVPIAPPLEQGVRACNICVNATFADVDDQRTHFRSDWHRYNVKARLANGRVVNEADFGHLIEGMSN